MDAHQLHEGDTGEMLHVRNQIIPVGRLATVLNLDRTLSKMRRAAPRRRSSRSEKKLGLVVDDFLGQEETVIKPLGSQLGHVSGVAGSTITGEGNVRLILDPAGIVEILAGKGK